MLILLATLSFAGIPALAQNQADSNSPPAESNATEPEAEDVFSDMDSLLEFSTLPADESASVRSDDDAIQRIAQQSQELRDPFWPYGFVPKKVPKPEDDAPADTTPDQPKPPVTRKPKWNEAVKSLSVKGIMNIGGGKYMAVINGQVCGEGDTVSAVYQNLRYNWTVHTISEDGVKFQKVGAPK